jgi:hypothetical protein
MENIITLEEHFLSNAHQAAHNSIYKGLQDELLDIGLLRLQHMDSGEVAVQVISHVPANFQPDGSRAAKTTTSPRPSPRNTQEIRAGFRRVAHVSDPGAAAFRAAPVRYGILGFVAALVDGHSDGR